MRGALTRSAIVYMLLFCAVGCWSAYASVLFPDLGVGLAVIGLLASVPAAVSIVGAPTWGLVADRLGDVRPPLLVAGLWAASAAALLVLQPPMPWIALVVAILAAGSSGLTPLVDARTVERLGRARDRFGEARAFGSLGFILATLAVGVLVQATGTLAMLAVYVPSLALTGIVGAALLGRGSRTARASGVGPIRALGLLRDPGMGLFFAGSVVVWVAATGIMAFFSLRLIELGGDARLVGIGWAANAVLEIPTMLAYRRLAGRLRVQWLLVVRRGDLRRPGRPVRRHRERDRPRARGGARRHRLRPVPRRDDDLRRAAGARRAAGHRAGPVHEHGASPSAPSSAGSSPVSSPRPWGLAAVFPAADRGLRHRRRDDLARGDPPRGARRRDGDAPAPGVATAPRLARRSRDPRAPRARCR